MLARITVLFGLAACWRGSVATQSAAPLPPPPVAAITCERIGQRHVPRGHFREVHIGVDFNLCGDEKPIAIADGEVTSVSIGGDESKGSFVVIYHQFTDGQLVGVLYAHLKDVRLRKGDRVKRGQPLGEIWVPTTRRDLPDWPRHVHLSVLGAGVPVEARDPLRIVYGCLSTAAGREWVYPVSC